jgi:hypothetical protein
LFSSTTIGDSLQLAGFNDAIVVHQFGVATVVMQGKSQQNNQRLCAKSETNLCSLSLLQDSSTNSTQLPIWPILKEQIRSKNDVWFIDLEKKCSII